MQLTEKLYRVTAPNPGFMTGNGTNSYLLRAKSGDCLIIDPGPVIDSHIQALIECAGGSERIKAIALTHMHSDHSPAAMPLAAVTGAKIYSPFSVDDAYQDKTLVSDYIVEHDQVIQLDDIRLRCIYTPGHVDNHMCFLLENEQVLMTGDHIMQGSTVVIIPPHGNMKKYLASLALLKSYAIQILAPGHGELIHTPEAEIDGIIHHRLKREEKVLQGLIQCGGANLQRLTEVVYTDVDKSLHLMASFSLLAHLLKLEEEGRAEQINDEWKIKIEKGLQRN